MRTTYKKACEAGKKAKVLKNVKCGVDCVKKFVINVNCDYPSCKGDRNCAREIVTTHTTTRFVAG